MSLLKSVTLYKCYCVLMLRIGSPGCGLRSYWQVYPTGFWEPQWDPTGPPGSMYWKSNKDFCPSQMSSEPTPSNICSNMRRSCSANINMAGVGTPVQTFTSGKLRWEPKLMKAVRARLWGSNEGDAWRLVMSWSLSNSDCCSEPVFHRLAAPEIGTSCFFLQLC